MVTQPADGLGSASYDPVWVLAVEILDDPCQIRVVSAAAPFQNLLPGRVMVLPAAAISLYGIEGPIELGTK
jgi:hypothetical protein